MPSAKAMVGDVVIAESDRTILIEGNHYFPPNDVNLEFLRDSAMHTVCPWKGEASYKTVVIDDNELVDAAWFYPEPKTTAIDRAGNFSGYYAFWRGVTVKEN